MKGKVLTGIGVVALVAVAGFGLFQWKGSEVMAEINPPTCPDTAGIKRDFIYEEVLPELKATTSDETPDQIERYHGSFVQNKVAFVSDGNIWVVDLVKNQWTKVASGPLSDYEAVIMLPSEFLLAIRQERTSPIISDLYVIPPFSSYDPWYTYRVTLGEEFYGGLLETSDQESLFFRSYTDGRNYKLWEYKIGDSFSDFKPKGECEPYVVD